MKSKKDKYISDKIREIMSEGKSQDQAIAIALSMANEKFKSGGTKLPQYQDGDQVILTGEQGLLPMSNNQGIEDKKVISSYRPISYLQKGVTDAEGKSGVYFWYKRPGDKDFNIETDREFIPNSYFDMIRRDPNMRNEALDAYFRKNPTQKFEDGGDYLPMYEDGGGNPPSYTWGYTGGNNYMKDLNNWIRGNSNQEEFKPFNTGQQNTWLPGNLPLNSNFGNVDFNKNKPTPKPTQEEFDSWNNSFNKKQPSTEQVNSSNTQQPKLKSVQEQVGDSLKPATQDTASVLQKIANEQKQSSFDLKDQETPDSSFTQQDPIQFFNPYGGVDLNSAASIFGQSLQSGDALSGVASGVKLFAGLGRNFMGGFAAGKAREEAISDYERNRRNAMTGVNRPVSMQEGGEMQQNPIQEQILMMLQQGATPEQVLEQLISSGVPQEQAIQAIQMVMQSAQQEAQAMSQEEVIMQEGGMFNQPEVPEQMANAEIEDGEYVRDGQGIKYAEGEKHSNGGIPTQLENGAQVLSDFKKVGKELAKQLSEQLGVKVRPTDTFASVLDKYDIKSGYKETQEEVEAMVKKISDQEKKVKNDATLALNKQVLSEEVEEEMQELSKMEGTRQQVFDLLFQSQEATKAQEVQQGNFMRDGGTIRDLMTKYNISEEDAKTLIPNYQGIFPSQYPETSIVPFDPDIVGAVGVERNRFEPNAFGKQREVGTNYYGDVVTYNSMDVQNQIKRLHPDLYDKYFKDNKIKPSDVANFQRDINLKYDTQLNNAKKLYGENSPQYKQLATEVENNKFLADDSVRSFDAKFGDFTSTRPNFRLPVLPTDVFMKMQRAGVTNSSQMQQQFPEEYDKYIKSKGLEGDFILGLEQDKGQAPIEVTPTAEVPLTPEQAIVAEEEKKKGRLNMMLLPDQTPMQPWGMLPPAMTTQTIYAPKYNEIDPQEQLMEIQRNKLNTLVGIQNLPDSQQAASALALDANTNMATNKVMTETDRYDTMARERTEGAEAMQKTQQSQANIVGLQQYQQLLGQELEANEADWRNFYNRLNSNNMNNWMTINEVNRANAFNPNIQQTSNGFAVQNIVPKTLEASSLNLNFNDQKNKKKK